MRARPPATAAVGREGGVSQLDREASQRSLPESVDCALLIEREGEGERGEREGGGEVDMGQGEMGAKRYESVRPEKC